MEKIAKAINWDHVGRDRYGLIVINRLCVGNHVCGPHARIVERSTGRMGTPLAHLRGKGS